MVIDTAGSAFARMRSDAFAGSESYLATSTPFKVILTHTGGF